MFLEIIPQLTNAFEFFKDEILPYAMAIVMAIVNGAVYISKAKSAIKTTTNTLDESINILKKSNDTTVAEQTNAIENIRNLCVDLIGQVQHGVETLPIEKLKQAQVANANAILQMQEYFKVMFTWQYEQAMSNASISPETKEALKKMYEDSMAKISANDLSLTMNEVKTMIEGAKDEELETEKSNT